MWFFYTQFIRLYGLALRLLALLGHSKAKAWQAGRVAQSRSPWPEALRQRGQGQPLYWMHCASAGEFEQGRAVWELWRQREPEALFVLTFFSPSGYERYADRRLADAVLYLPLDLPHPMRQFLEALKPSKAVFVKYEFWAWALRLLAEQDVPTYLIAAEFRARQVFFRWYGGFFRRLLPYYRAIMLQTEASATLLRGIGYPADKLAVLGDPRLDRVLAIKAEAKPLPDIEAFIQGQPLWVAGSTWPEDEALLAALLPQLPPQLKLIIAPHEVGEAKVKAALARFEPWGVLPYSLWQQKPQQPAPRILLIDNIGLLNRLYRYAQRAYIGGGFGAGIHNTLEAGVYGIPLAFGPNYRKFPEARYQVEQGLAWVWQHAQQAQSELAEFAFNPEREAQVKAAWTAYLEQNAGAAQRILAHL